jgi:hypothetical protein
MPASIVPSEARRSRRMSSSRCSKISPIIRLNAAFIEAISSLAASTGKSSSSPAAIRCIPISSSFSGRSAVARTTRAR